ncbi:MAG: carboxypeptidase-like regulatory domain-containing protein [Gemmatimonadota bacterium]
MTTQLRIRSALLLALAPTFTHSVQAQSGRASLNGWVAFEDVAYVDTQPRATVQLRHAPPDTGVVYTTTTDAHGFYHFNVVALGSFVLRISAPKFQDYSAEVYLPSDFAGNWAVQLKARKGAAH